MTMFRNLGLALDVVRQIRARSQAAVSREAKIGKSQLSKYERGKELPRLESLEKILTVLKVGPFEFFYILHTLDQSEHRLSGTDEALGESTPFARPGNIEESIDEGFQRVVNDVFLLYRQVLEASLREGR